MKQVLGKRFDPSKCRPMAVDETRDREVRLKPGSYLGSVCSILQYKLESPMLSLAVFNCSFHLRNRSKVQIKTHEP